MKQFLFLFLLITISMLAVGCSPVQQDTVVEQTQIVIDQTDAAMEYEVRITDTGFSPATFEGLVGEEMTLVFLLDQQHEIVIDAFNIAQTVQESTLVLSLTEKGEFDMVCSDCENNAIATIVVN